MSLDVMWPDRLSRLGASSGLCARLIVMSGDRKRRHAGMGRAEEAKLAGGARRMGSTGLIVSRIGYGAMELAGAPRARAMANRDAIRFINRVVDLGINYIDTSIDYGLSEQLIGKALGHRRADIILASKCACQVGIEGSEDRGEKHIYTGENVTAG